MAESHEDKKVISAAKLLFYNLPKVVTSYTALVSPEMSLMAQSFLLGLDIAGAARQDQRNKRYETILKELASEVERLGKVKLDARLFKSPEFLNLLEQSAIVCFKANSDLNVQEALKILKTTVRAEEIKIGASEYMRALSELSEPELILLKTLYRMQKDHPYVLNSDDSSWYESVRWKDLLAETGMASSEHIHFMLNRIASTGFIIQNTPRTTDEVGEKGAAFRITSTLRGLMQSLEDNAV
ncbi:hypothetical protein D3C87_110340 [compost metagenome]